MACRKRKTNIKKETFLCAQCGVPLHPEACYTWYHTWNITEDMF